MKRKVRVSIGAATLSSRDDAERVLGEVRDFTLQAIAVKTELEQIKHKAEEQAAPQLERLGREIAMRAEQLKAWAESAPAEFGARKSLDLTHGTIGWRVSPPACKTLPKWTWDDVLSVLDQTGEEQFVRVDRSPNKEALIAAREELGQAGLAARGVRIVQPETFFVTPRVAEIEETTKLPG